jgi:lysophospholipase L1-like esterase
MLLLIAPAGARAAAPPVPVKAKPVVWVALGDSFTYGTELADRATQAWPALVERHLPKGSHVVDLSAGANTLRVALLLDVGPAIKSHPTMMTVWLGLDDLDDGDTAAAAAARLDTLLARLEVTHARIFVINYPDLGVLPSSNPLQRDRAKVLAYDRAIPAIAVRHHTTVIDMVRFSQSILGRPDSLGFTIFPSAAAHARMATIIYDALHQHKAF